MDETNLRTNERTTDRMESTTNVTTENQTNKQQKTDILYACNDEHFIAVHSVDKCMCRCLRVCVCVHSSMAASVYVRLRLIWSEMHGKKRTCTNGLRCIRCVWNSIGVRLFVPLHTVLVKCSAHTCVLVSLFLLEFWISQRSKRVAALSHRMNEWS